MDKHWCKRKPITLQTEKNKAQKNRTNQSKFSIIWKRNINHRTLFKNCNTCPFFHENCSTELEKGQSCISSEIFLLTFQNGGRELETKGHWALIRGANKEQSKTRFCKTLFGPVDRYRDVGIVGYDGNKTTLFCCKNTSQ